MQNFWYLLLRNFMLFWPNFYFWKGYCELGSFPTQFLDFPNFFMSEVVRQLAGQLIDDVFNARYQVLLYLRWIKSILNYCIIIPKYYAWDWALSCKICEIFKNSFFMEHLLTVRRYLIWVKKVNLKRK